MSAFENQVDLELLRQIADLEKVPQGAYNIRKDGQLDSRSSTANIEISTKEDKPGIDIRIKAGTKNESVHIPVIITQMGVTEMVYNDFFIGDDCDVMIVAGCGIHNEGDEGSAHDGIHAFAIGKNSKVKYIEKHYGEGKGTGERIMNPTMTARLGEGSVLELESVQIGGIDSTVRKTTAVLEKDAKLIVIANMKRFKKLK